MKKAKHLTWGILLSYVLFGCGKGSDAPPDGGASSCAATDCAGSCVDTNSSATHCGACNVACGDDEVCSSGTCAADCEAGLTRCGQDCPNRQSSVTHCGSCDNSCDTGAACVSGACMAVDAAGGSDGTGGIGGGNTGGGANGGTGGGANGGTGGGATEGTGGAGTFPLPQGEWEPAAPTQNRPVSGTFGTSPGDIVTDSEGNVYTCGTVAKQLTLYRVASNEWNTLHTATLGTDYSHCHLQVDTQDRVLLFHWSGNDVGVLRWDGGVSYPFGSGKVPGAPAAGEELFAMDGDKPVISTRGNNSINVVRWTGTEWQKLSNSPGGFGAGLTVAGGDPVLISIDATNQKTYSHRYETGWEDFGAAPFGKYSLYQVAAGAYEGDILFAGVPQDGLGNPFQVLTWTGSEWDQLGGPIGPAGLSGIAELEVAWDHPPLVAGSKNGKAHVYGWDGDEWKEVGGGGPGFPYEPSARLRLARDPDGSVWALVANFATGVVDIYHAE